MFDIGDTLREGLDEACRRMHEAQTNLARANAGEAAGRKADGAMAQTAEAAIFTEALLNAEHARFSEIKSVVK
jgi:hypothetical protein